MNRDRTPKAASTANGDTSAVVLVVDDDAVSRTLVEDALDTEGFTVIEVDNGEKAVAMFQIHRPELVVMDALMPGMDGFQACKALRDLPGGLDVPVLMLTGCDDVDAIARAFEAGATDFATKPIPWQVLAHRAATCSARSAPSKRCDGAKRGSRAPRSSRASATGSGTSGPENFTGPCSSRGSSASHPAPSWPTSTPPWGTCSPVIVSSCEPPGSA